MTRIGLLAAETSVQFLFGEYTLDTDTRELRLRDALISTQPQVFDLLTYLGGSPANRKSTSSKLLLEKPVELQNACQH